MRPIFLPIRNFFIPDYQCSFDRGVAQPEIDATGEQPEVSVTSRAHCLTECLRIKLSDRTINGVQYGSDGACKCARNLTVIEVYDTCLLRAEGKLTFIYFGQELEILSTSELSLITHSFPKSLPTI